MPKLTRLATFVILSALGLFLYACGDDPVSPPDDTTRPTVVSVSPVDGASFVSVSSDISVTFSEAMNQSSMILSTLNIVPAVTGSISYSNKVLTFDPDSFLLGDTTYTVTVSSSAKDKAGNALASPYIWQFSTDLDNTPPTVVSTSPSADAVNVPVNSTISVKFSEDMEPSAMSSAFQINPSVSGGVSYADSTLIFTPASFLTGDQTYEVTVTMAATDTADNHLASDYVWQFTTLNDTDPPNGAIASPDIDAVIGNSTTIAVSASDETGVEKVVFYIDGAEVVGSDDYTEPYEYTWDASGLDTGSVHEITAEVFDVLGNSTFVDTIEVHYLWRLLISDDDEELIHRDINTVHVRSGGSLLEFRVQTWGGWTVYNSEDNLGILVAIYLDTDQNRATGDTTASDGNPAWEPPGVIGLNDIGAEYRIQIGGNASVGDKDALWSWNGSGWTDQGDVDLFNITTNSNYFEVGVLRNRIGLPDAVDVVAFSFTLFKNPTLPGDPGTYKWDWAPNEGTGHATYVVDGSFSGAPPLSGKRAISTAAPDAVNRPRVVAGPEPFN